MELHSSWYERDQKCAQRWLGMRRLKHLVSVRFEFRDEFAHVKKI